MPNPLQKTISGLSYAAVAILVWSGSLIMLRLGVTTELNAYDLTALRFGTAAAVLAPFAWRYGRGTDQLGLFGLGAMVITFGAPYILLIALAMTTAPANAAGALNPGVMAISAVLLGRILCGDRIGVARYAGLSLTTFGIAFFILAGSKFATGHLILVATGAMWAGYALIVRSAAIPAINATAIVAVGSAVTFLPVYLIWLPKQITAAPWPDILAQAAFQGCLVSVVAIYAFNRSAELLGPVVGASLPALIPVVTLGLGTIFLGEIAQPAEIAAVLLVTIGLALILLKVR